MKTARLTVALCLALVIAGGYAASQYAYILGPEASADFESKVNDPRVHLLMLVLFVGAILLGLIPDREENSR